jgi:uncharacterized protein (DUF342 family)
MKLITEDIRRSTTPVVHDDAVEVMGTIRSGAKLQVTGDVTVYGNVEDAEIEAGGSVRIDGGFLGKGGGLIRCGGDLCVRFIQGQRGVAKGDIEIASAAISSTLFSSGNILVGQGDGVIVGGELHAYGNIEAGVLGSRRPVMTRISAGLDPMIALRIGDLETQVMNLTRRRQGLLKDLSTLSRETCDEAPSVKAADIQAAADAIQGDIIASGERIVALRKGARLNPDSRIVAHRASYPPLEISICFVRIMTESSSDAVVFRLFEDNIVLDLWNLE